jgi:oxygen-independent coproporphyrinogen-3 oxidase
MISLYIHIPFCFKKKCSYCDFFSLPVDGLGDEHVRKYRDALVFQFKHEVNRLGLADRGLHSIYIGGGTPSLLPVGFFEKLMIAFGTTFVMQSDIEVTCEVNPATADAQWFKDMVGVGVSRFSIGVQSFQDAKLKKLGRQHDSKDAQRTIAEALESGADSVNVDLMYGLPGQKTSDVESDLKTTMTFQPNHISAYQLTVEDGSGRFSLPREQTVLEQLRLVRRMLSRGGWNAYEISNFAKPHFACKHNMHYWRYGEYIGLGAGATSFMIDEEGNSADSRYARRWTMTRDVDGYLKGLLAEVDVDVISRRTSMGEFCFLGLRTDEGVALDDFEQRYGIKLQKAFPDAVEDLSERGLLQVKDGRLRLTSEGIELSNQVFERFVE